MKFEVGWSKSNGTLTIESQTLFTYDSEREAWDSLRKYADQHGYESIHDEYTMQYKKGKESLHVWYPYGENK